MSPSQIQQVVVAGIGNPWRGDDGAGSLLARRLADAGASGAIDCEEVPENHLDRLCAGPPRLVVLCDAVDFGGKPGDVRWLAPEQLAARSSSTHRVSLRLLASYLHQAGVPSVWILGIQPGRTDLGADITPPVVQAVDQLQRQLGDLLRRGPDALQAFIDEQINRGQAPSAAAGEEETN